MNFDLTSRPWAEASFAMAAERVMSSYEELVQEPMRPTLRSAGQSFFLTSSANLEIGVARSGVKGPLMWGSSSDRFYNESKHQVLRGETGTYDVDHLVVIGALVRLEVVLKGLRVVRDIRALRRVQVVDHARVEGEKRGRCADFGTHVADCAHARGGEGFYARAEVFDDCARAAFDGEDSGDFKDDIWFFLPGESYGVVWRSVRQAFREMYDKRGR